MAAAGGEGGRGEGEGGRGRGKGKGERGGNPWGHRNLASQPRAVELVKCNVEQRYVAVEALEEHALQDERILIIPREPVVFKVYIYIYIYIYIVRSTGKLVVFKVCVCQHLFFSSAFFSLWDRACFGRG
jgi:hypothetical protein